MAGMNLTILCGNLTRDPELRYLPSGTAVAAFGVAANRRWKSKEGEDKEETVFVDITAFGKQAELLAERFKKGSQILLRGRLALDQWEDKDTGAKRSRLYVLMEEFSFMGEKKQGPPKRAVRDEAYQPDPEPPDDPWQ